jgi:hypothetical protein
MRSARFWLAVASAALALLCAGCDRTWESSTPIKDDWRVFTGPAWRTPSPEPSPSADVTEAARDLLPYRDRIIAAYAIAERPEAQQTGGWVNIDSPEAIASGVAGAKLQTIASIDAIYRAPSVRASRDVWDSVQPSGAYLVRIARDGAADELFTLRRDQNGRWWYLDDAPLPLVYLQTDEAQIRRLAGGRSLTLRYVWKTGLFSWWLVRFGDGTVAAWPSDHTAIIFVGGSPLEDKLYPASAIFDEVRYGGPT